LYIISPTPTRNNQTQHTHVPTTTVIGRFPKRATSTFTSKLFTKKGETSSAALAEDFAEIEGCGRDFTSKSSLEEHVRTAHLGLGSKRVERNKKRKAAALKSGEQPEQKKRKSRKGQGKKTAALSALTGVTYDAEEASEDGDDEMGEQLTGFETMVDGQIYGQDLGFTDRVAYGQHTYDPQGYHSAARDNAFSSTDLFNDAEFVSRSPLDPLLLLSG
jgi:hypothetical protein